jgi:hypothetical protein
VWQWAGLENGPPQLAGLFHPITSSRGGNPFAFRYSASPGGGWIGGERRAASASERRLRPRNARRALAFYERVAAKHDGKIPSPFTGSIQAKELVAA